MFGKDYRCMQSVIMALSNGYRSQAEYERGIRAKLSDLHDSQKLKRNEQPLIPRCLKLPPTPRLEPRLKPHESTNPTP